jgi:hypothetical protein
MKKFFMPNSVTTDDKLPGNFVNSMLLNLMRVEKSWIKKHSFPFGVSIMAVIKKI